MASIWSIDYGSHSLVISYYNDLRDEITTVTDEFGDYYIPNVMGLSRDTNNIQPTIHFGKVVLENQKLYNIKWNFTEQVDDNVLLEFFKYILNMCYVYTKNIDYLLIAIDEISDHQKRRQEKLFNNLGIKNVVWVDKYISVYASNLTSNLCIVDWGWTSLKIINISDGVILNRYKRDIGGEDLTNNLVRWVTKEITNFKSRNLKTHTQNLANWVTKPIKNHYLDELKIYTKCENIKMELSTNTSAEFIYSDYETVISRKLFDDINKEVYSEVIDVITNFVKPGVLVIFIGGCNKNNYIKNYIKKYNPTFYEKYTLSKCYVSNYVTNYVSNYVNRYADNNKMDFSNSDKGCISTISLSIDNQEICTPIIYKGAILPISRTLVLTALSIDVYIGERQLVKHNCLVKNIVLDKLQKFKLTIDINESQNVTVHILHTDDEYKQPVITFNFDLENLGDTDSESSEQSDKSNKSDKSDLSYIFEDSELVSKYIKREELSQLLNKYQKQFISVRDQLDQLLIIRIDLFFEKYKLLIDNYNQYSANDLELFIKNIGEEFHNLLIC